MNTSGATEKVLSKENLEQLISAKYASVIFSKNNEKDVYYFLHINISTHVLKNLLQWMHHREQKPHPFF